MPLQVCVSMKNGMQICEGQTSRLGIKYFRGRRGPRDGDVRVPRDGVVRVHNELGLHG